MTLVLGASASPFSQPANVSFNKASVTIKPGKEATVKVTLRVAASAIPSSNGADQFAFHEVSGNVTLTGGGTDPAGAVPARAALAVEHRDEGPGLRR